MYRSILIRLLLVVVIITGTVAPVTNPIVPAASRPAAVPIEESVASLPDTPAAPPYDLPEQLAGKAELTALRTANSATYDMGDGTYALLQDSAVIHYQDADGQWQPINPAFAAVEKGWVNETNSLHTSLSKHNSTARVGTSAIGVGWEPQALEVAYADGRTQAIAQVTAGGSSTRSADGRTVRYAGNWPVQGVADQWQSNAGSAEYTLQLTELPAARASAASLDVRVRLHLHPGTKLEVAGQPVSLPLETSDQLTFVGADGAMLDLMPPAAYEQDRPEARVAGRYALAATADPSVIELRVQTPWQWMAAPDRQLPVVIDPLFQLRGATSLGVAQYLLNNGSLSYLGLGVDSTLTRVGRHKNGSSDLLSRALVRFDLPRMPPGTVINKAYLLAMPTSINSSANGQDVDRTHLRQKVTAHVITSLTEWWNGNITQPTYNPTPLTADQQYMEFSVGEKEHSGILWDVTTAAQGWLPNVFTSNNGILLRVEKETCDLPDFSLSIANPDCGAFYFDQQPSWSLDDLQYTQFNSDPNAPAVGTSTVGGLRLIVFYTGPTLVENGVVNMNQWPGQNMPPNSEPPSPYYMTDHLYTVPTMPTTRWQALVARSFAPAVGPVTPTLVGLGNAYRVYLRESVPLKLRAENDSFEIRNVTAPKDKVGYMLLDGRGTVSPFTDNPLVLRVPGSVNTLAPVGYDLRLMREDTTTISTTLGTQFIVNATFDSAEPLKLYNLKLPVGSNTRVKITVNGDSTRPGTYLSLFADDFRAHIVNSDSQIDLPTSDNLDVQTSQQTIADWQLSKSISGTSSTIFTPQAGQYALAVSYSGPALTVYDEEACGSEFCNFSVIPIKYNIRIETLSCAPGSFPTQNGTCQKLVCPNTATFPYNSATYTETSGLGFWSAAGWDVNGNSIVTDTAPLIGPTGHLTPTVAVIGGVIHATTNPVSATLSANSTVMLVKCPSPTGSNGNFSGTPFNVFNGAMVRGLRGFFVPVMEPMPAGSGQVVPDPWLPDDKIDMSDIDNYVAPPLGLFYGGVTLHRVVGDGPYTSYYFKPYWNWTADGWSSLTSTITISPVNGLVPTHTIASLILNLGSSFSLDTTPANGSAKRSFKAVRANAATISQPVSLGGASKPLKAVILPRNVRIPVLDVSCDAHCLDLRGLNDDPLSATPDRYWSIPDVHTNIKAGTLLMSKEGSLTVFSKDHPYAANGTTFEFSFDFLYMTGSQQLEKCDPGDPEPVMVLRSEGRIIMPPNIGDTSLAEADPIVVSIKECATSLRNVHIEFNAPGGLAVGDSGLGVASLTGDFDVFPDYARITLATKLLAPTGAALGGKLLNGSGELVIDTRGLFEMQGSAKILGKIGASGKLWVAWNPLDIGIEMEAQLGAWLSGMMRIHEWVGQGWGHKYTWLPDNKDVHFAGQIAATLTFEAGSFGTLGIIDLPPMDLTYEAEIAFGQFCVSSSCTVYEWGIKGTLSVIGYDFGLYYGFDKGFDLILGNDGHVLIDQYGGVQPSPAKLSANLQAVVEVQRAPQAVNGVALIPFTISPQAEEMLIGLGWQAGLPALTLIDPNGVEITPVNAAAHQAQFLQQPDSTLIGVEAPLAGQWQAKISGLSDEGIEHYQFFFFSNKGAPGTPGNQGAFTAPSAANEPATDVYTITWQIPVDTPISSTISLYYYQVTNIITGNLGQGVPVVKNLPFNAGQYQWNTTGLPNGTYQLRAEVDDGINDLPADKITQPIDTCTPIGTNLPHLRAFDPARFPGTVVFTSTGTLLINDVTPPAAPTDLQLSGVDSALMARWTASTSPDVTLYLVRWGPRVGNTNVFTVANQKLMTAQISPTLYIGAVNNGMAYGVDVTAIDAGGNTSAPGTPAFATPSGAGDPVPLAPVFLTLSGVSSTSASFQWQAGPGPVPAGYRLRYVKLSKTTDLGYKDVATTSGTLTDLVTGATYDVDVAALNSGGWQSAMSSPVRVLISNGVDGNGDGLPDDWASYYGVAGANNDPDGDGINNANEFLNGTDPMDQDSDGDGLSDGEEAISNTDPLDNSNYGVPVQPHLLLDQYHLIFKPKLQPGGEAAPQTVQWYNVGGGVLNPQAITADSWLTASVGISTVQVSVLTDTLTSGFHSGVLQLNAGPGSDPLIGSPACIRVDAWVLRADNDTTRWLYLPLILR